MSRHHANLIRSIFHDPPSGDLHWREIEALLKHIGASAEACRRHLSQMLRLAGHIGSGESSADPASPHFDPSAYWARVPRVAPAP